MNIDPLRRGRGVEQLDGDFSKVKLADYARDGGMFNDTLGSGRPVKTEFIFKPWGVPEQYHREVHIPLSDAGEGGQGGKSQ
jgi:hypothetical protein